MIETFFRAREPEVTCENFDRETLVVDLKTGHYHSLRDAAARVWRLLAEGHGLETSIARLADVYGMSPDNLEADVRDFVADLTRLNLLESIPQPAAQAESTAEPPGEPYAKPVLESYTDLRDLLLLDPIHEVTAAGWPHKSAATP